VLAHADPEDKADLYAELEVSLTYHTDGRVAVQALPRGVQVRACRRRDLRLAANAPLTRVVTLSA
jgi:hypothetical protein